MAIQNASDLLVYKKSGSSDVAQVTRIIIDYQPASAAVQFGLENTYDASGSANGILNVTVSTYTTSGTATAIRAVFVANGYSATAVTAGTTIGLPSGSQYFDVTNTFAGDLPDIDISLGWESSIQQSLYEDYIDFSKFSILVLTSGSTANAYEPIAYSTSASATFSLDLRDTTTKDSAGWSESEKGLKSFEISTDALWNLNADVDLQELFNDYKDRTEITLRFKQRTSGGSDKYYEGNAYVSSLSVDAGVEDNVTYSVSFTGTAAATEGTD